MAEFEKHGGLVRNGVEYCVQAQLTMSEASCLLRMANYFADGVGCLEDNERAVRDSLRRCIQPAWAEVWKDNKEVSNVGGANTEGNPGGVQ
jgi:hypothetical protein